VFCFTCNLCNSPCSVNFKEEIGRENRSCSTCGSGVRFRWIIHALSLELFGKSIPLPLFPRAKEITGIGLTDSGTFVFGLAKKLNFTNTYFHREPRIDLTDATSGEDGAYDFIIASEVFEHIPPPVQLGFNNLARLLSPNGFVIFTVPWNPDGHTIEHYPDLFDWKVVRLRSGPVLVTVTITGEAQAFRNPVFHGGDGETLEMRLFSKDDLVRHFDAAGFQRLKFSEIEAALDYGIIWEPWSRGLVARK
jgi:SAM-dependent methyltransferase